MELKLIKPDWEAPANVHAFTTTRIGGFSEGPWSSLNLGMNCGDNPLSVRSNLEQLEKLLPARPQWLWQVHGPQVAEHPGFVDQALEADGLITAKSSCVCSVLTADCLPVFFCDVFGSQVAIAHAGWRGLAGGVLQQVVNNMRAAPSDLLVWLGPAIGADVYEVQDDVKTIFGPDFASCFTPYADRWLFDMYLTARIVLKQLGVLSISGGDFCTFSDQTRFFSYRRDKITGRMASLIWMEA